MSDCETCVVHVPRLHLSKFARTVFSQVLYVLIPSLKAYLMSQQFRQEVLQYTLPCKCVAASGVLFPAIGHLSNERGKPRGDASCTAQPSTDGAAYL